MGMGARGVGGSIVGGGRPHRWAHPWRRQVEQLTRSRDVLDAPAVGERTVVADAMEAAGQHVDEEAADELVDGERHQLGAVAPLRPIVLPPEGHAGVVERDEPAVGDGDAVGVAREIGEHSLGSAEGALAVDDPFGLAQRREIGGEGAALGQLSVIAEELQAAGVVGGGELLQEQSPEQPREHADGKEEAGPTRDPALAVERDAAARDDDMGVRIMRGLAMAG